MPVSPPSSRGAREQILPVPAEIQALTENVSVEGKLVE
jgi:hypothetical protein